MSLVTGDADADANAAWAWLLRVVGGATVTTGSLLLIDSPTVLKCAHMKHLYFTQLYCTGLTSCFIRFGVIRVSMIEVITIYVRLINGHNLNPDFYLTNPNSVRTLYPKP